MEKGTTAIGGGNAYRTQPRELIQKPLARHNPASRNAILPAISKF